MSCRLLPSTHKDPIYQPLSHSKQQGSVLSVVLLSHIVCGTISKELPVGDLQDQVGPASVQAPYIPPDQPCHCNLTAL